MPQISAAGSTAFRALTPPITNIRYAGTNRETGAQILPTSALSWPSGRLVTVASVTSGVPMAPKATGEVLAIRQMAAAWNGENPNPLNIAAATATGVPNPEAPSTNAPNAKAIRSA